MNINARKKEILEELSYLPDWEDKYAYIIDLGKKLSLLEDVYKTEENRIHGCISNLWLTYKIDDDGKYQFYADSDSFLVKGLLAIIIRILSDSKAEEILSFDLNKLIEELNLKTFLTPNRNNGFVSVINTIKNICNNPPTK